MTTEQRQPSRLLNPWLWLPWIMIALGIVLRLSQYLANRSLWLDEAALALNIVGRSFTQLVQPLDYNQGAPIGFLMIEKLAVQVFGDNEYALRLFPLVSGMVSLFLFYPVAKRYIQPSAALIGLGLFLLSVPLISYSSETKQYSSDVMITLILLGLTSRLGKSNFAFGYMVLLGVIGTASIWFSHPATFVLVGIGASLALSCFIKKRWGQLCKLAIPYLLWGTGFLAFYLVSLSSLENNSSLVNYWQGGFMPLPPRSLTECKWFVDTFFGMFDNPAGIYLSGLAALTFLIGGVSMLADRQEKLGALISPMLVTLLASGLHKYPFSGRLILFTAPIMLILVAEGVQQIRDKTKPGLIGSALAVMLFVHPVLAATDILIKPRAAEEIRPVVSYIRGHYQTDDVLYVYYGAHYAFRYYASKYGFGDEDYIVGISSRKNWNSYADDLGKLRGNRRVWAVFSHIWVGDGVNEERFFLYRLDRMGARLDSFGSPGASVYLYDLSPR